MSRWDTQTTDSIPDWFWQAVDTESTQDHVEIDECDVYFRYWGDRAKQPVLLIHGMNAHSRWWDFIAPQLTDDYFLVAMDLTGMGDSDFRYEYSASGYIEEIVGVCDHLDLGTDVILVGHSFGGRMATKAAAIRPERFGALFLVDSGIRHPDEPDPEIIPLGGGRAKTYPNREAGEARFRLQPPQPCENEYLLKYIARHSLMRVEGGGWEWKFDADLPTSLVAAEADPRDYTALSVPVILIYGQNSLLYTVQTNEYTKSLIPNVVSDVAIANAQHHVFLDQPLQFVTEMRSALETLTS